MQVLISSGTGIAEVCRALWHFHRWLETRYRVTVIEAEPGEYPQCYKSLLLACDDAAITALEGTHLWQCKSPFRLKHKRMNWYFELQVLDTPEACELLKDRVIYQTMKSPKKGGQHVNKTESGVRALYPPLDLSAVSYDHRSQRQNRKAALQRLEAKAQQLQQQQHLAQGYARFQRGCQLERGNAVKVFVGETFQESR